MKPTKGTEEERRGVTGTGPATESGAKTATLETCHPSVCVGGVTPTNCICPTTSAK